MSHLTNKNSRLTMVLAAIPLVVAAALISLGGFISYQQYRYHQTLAIAPGRIIANTLKSHPQISQKAGSSKAVYHPVVTFQTKGGTMVQFTDSVGTNPPDYQIGESVEVFYNLENQNEVFIKSWKSQWLLPTTLITFGGIALLAGIGALMSTSSQNRDRYSNNAID